MKSSSAAFLLIGSTLAVAVAVCRGASGVAPSADFTVTRWQTGEGVRLSEFAGQIVVLDFFAYWCAPCRRASAEIERGIQQYYASAKGNPHGVPVRTMAVNIEKAEPQLTARFIREAGLEFVVDDVDGVLLETFAGAGTPFVVILDGTGASKDAPDFRVVYRRSGFTGTGKLRQVIDAIGPSKSGAGGVAESNRVATVTTSGPVRAQQGEFAFDALLAGDVQITSTVAGYGQKVGETEWKLSYTHQTYDLEYEPFKRFDFLGFPERLHESYDGGRAAVRHTVGERLTVLASGSVYDGFTDYRSVWLASYYRQQFHFVPGYEEPEPRGFNAGGGLRWAYQPTTGFIETDFVYANDEIAPGYELDQGTAQLTRSREILHTYSPILKFENVLTTRIRTLNEIQLTLTSGREPRYSYRGSVNVALGERWTWRMSGGYTHEDPALRAWFGGGTLEFALTPQWLVHLSGLYYRDTGEIENSLFISTSAPGLQTYQGGVGVRYVGRRFSFSLSAAPLHADYKPVEIGTRPFTNLYRDRTWVGGQAAWAVEF